MTQPVQSAPTTLASYSPPPSSVTPPSGQDGRSGAEAPTTIEVSRAANAPVYVYRVTDTATGRTLVEIPQQPAAPPGESVGRRVDAKV